MAHTVAITNFRNPIDAKKRATFLATIEKYADTDVLEILAKASAKKGSNDKVRVFQKLM